MAQREVFQHSVNRIAGVAYRAYSINRATNVRLFSLIFLSPSQGLCCSEECVPQSTSFLCLNETECSNSSFCKYPLCTYEKQSKSFGVGVERVFILFYYLIVKSPLADTSGKWTLICGRRDFSTKLYIYNLL